MLAHRSGICRCCSTRDVDIFHAANSSPRFRGPCPEPPSDLLGAINALGCLTTGLCFSDLACDFISEVRFFAPVPFIIVSNIARSVGENLG